jgi:glycosyltransferase involved in cell wall biosynthesis
MLFWLEITLFVLYVILGPLTWGFMILAMFEGRRKMEVLLKSPPLPDPAPLLTVMIPARNEAGNIELCVASVLSQDYPNLKIVVADDRSTDATPAILDRLAAENTNLTAVHLTQDDIIPGWAGKSNAIYGAYEKGVKKRAGDIEPDEFLLGLDSDVRLTRADALSLCVRGAIKHKAAIFSLLPALESQSFFEALVIPLTGMLSSSINAVALSNVDSFKNIAYANGQCLMIRREVYDAIGGHASVGPITAEDVAMATIVKQSGRRIRLAWGADLCRVRMYDSLGAIYRGLSRVISVSRDGRTWPMLIGIAFLTLCGFSLYPAAALALYRMSHPAMKYGAAGWAIAVMLHWAAMTVQLALTYAWSKNRWWHALLFPLGGGISLAIFIRALKQCLTGKFEWRGVTYSRKDGAMATTTPTR